ncbi:MerR family transcriptional regulator [Nocardia cyriacigeorgica]|uniref:Mercuric resistance operon regulatory protein n=1 Tax=Nocardia cyriacigeorgica TaxID=135487 RepID=A0A4U8VWE5_9NOCA|nr:MerR family transcriptional regulator [Nocardia cyriacigeorgica]VFA96935.1 Mercuric resistance operon regulatory protein [Nocardia cyriacigeorgica]
MAADSSGYLQIGQVAERTELSLKSIRHWDEVGLVQPSARSAGGFRLYTEADVERMLVIRRMKPLGFTLAEMKQLLSAIDALDDMSADPAARAAARADLLAFREKAADSAERLRRHLAYAEEFTDLLTRRSSDSLA